MMHAHGISNDLVLSRVVRKVDNTIHNPVDGVVCFVNTYIVSTDWMVVQRGRERYPAFE